MPTYKGRPSPLWGHPPNGGGPGERRLHQVKGDLLTERIKKRPTGGSEEDWRDTRTGFTAKVVLEHPEEPNVLEIQFGDQCERGITEQEAEEAFLIWCDSTRRTRIED